MERATPDHHTGAVVGDVFVLRCTKKLLRRIDPSIATMGEPPKLTTRLGDWYANLRIVRRQHLALAVSSVTLLPVLLPAAPFKTLPARVAEGVAQVLDALGIDEQGIAAEVAAMRECVVTTTNDRQILGSMNDFANMLDFYLAEGTMLEVALKLAESPCGPLGMESPKRATLALFGRPELPLVKVKGRLEPEPREEPAESRERRAADQGSAS